MCWGEWIIEELVRCGTECFCISPGSRSTPLTAAVARNSRAKSVLIYDERAAAYYALGHSRATGCPAVLICTSGTAAANYLPAVVEASIEQIPMLLLTADRPPELQDTGANQAVDQTHLFGKHVRWFFDPGCPSPEFPAEALFSTIDQAVFRTHYPLPGPVHLNLPFREPFENCELRDELAAQYESAFVKNTPSRKIPQTETVRELLKNRPESGILSIGRVPPESLGSVRKLAEALGWPVFADVTSGLRLGESGTSGANCPNRITYYDQLLLAGLPSANWEIGAVWHLGFPPTSKRWLTHWKEKTALQPERPLRPEDSARNVRCGQTVWIADHSERDDPTHRFRWRIEADISEFCDALVDELRITNHELAAVSPQTQKWLAASEKVENLMNEHFGTNPQETGVSGTSGMSGADAINEFALVRKLTEVLPENHAFFIGNSLSVRAVDMFASGKGAEIPVALNRGASGIDGLIATACGYAYGMGRPVTLLLGDLSALHDLNSFKLLADSPEQILLILLNNHGGGIFSLLPIAEQSDIFEEFFGTPHTLDFCKVSAMFGLNYDSPDSVKTFETLYAKAVSTKKSAVLEIFTERDKNLQDLKIWQKKLRQQF